MIGWGKPTGIMRKLSNWEDMMLDLRIHHMGFNLLVSSLVVIDSVILLWLVISCGWGRSELLLAVSFRRIEIRGWSQNRQVATCSSSCIREVKVFLWVEVYLWPLVRGPHLLTLICRLTSWVLIDHWGRVMLPLFLLSILTYLKVSIVWVNPIPICPSCSWSLFLL